MSDEDFDRLKEIVLKNLKEIENLFSLYLHEFASCKKLSFKYDELYRKYLNDITNLMDNECGNELLISIYSRLAPSFYEKKDEMILALINREEYIKYLEEHMPIIQADALLNLYNNLNDYLQGKLGDDFQIELNKYPKFFEEIIEMMKFKGYIYLNPSDTRTIENLINQYNDKNKENDLKEKCLNDSIDIFKITIVIIKAYLKNYYIFFDQRDKESLLSYYEDLVKISDNFKKEEFYDSIEEEIKNKYEQIFNGIDSSNSKKIYKFFDKNIDFISNYISVLKELIEKYYKFLYNEEKELFIKSIIKDFDVMSYLPQIDIATFTNNPSIKDFKMYYDKAFKIESLINCFFDIEYSDDEKLKNIVSYEMYEEIRTIFENSGCKDIIINNEIIEDIRNYIEMKQKIDNIHSVEEKEIVYNTFEKVKKLS